jgi:predicted DNA binding CopG/RHH family protein
VPNYRTTISGKKIKLTYKKPRPKPLPKQIKKRRINISLSPYWHQVGKDAAAAAGLSFSAYLEQLIYQDLLHNKSG